MRARVIGFGLLVGLLAAAAPAAADTQVDIGTSLASASIGFGDNETKSFGIPSAGAGVFSPSVFVAIFATPKIAVEPQLGFIWVKEGGSSNHIINFGGQIDYLLKDASMESPYLFASVGVLKISDESTTPKSGFRCPMDRFIARADARLQHYTDNGGNALITISIGGRITP